MPKPAEATVFGAAEGQLDIAVVRRLVEDAGVTVGPIHGGKGKPHLLSRLNGYNAAAAHDRWLVMVDLNGDADCAPQARNRWLPGGPSPHMCVRIAVRQVESWLMGDQERLANFLGVARNRVPAQPETVAEPKALMVNIAARSRRRDICADMCPRPESGRAIGPAYTSRLIEYVADGRSGWRPPVAAESSPSLARALRCLGRLLA